MPSKVCCSLCCSVFSAVGIAFLVTLGVILEAQPDFVKDLKDGKTGSISCFQSAGMYLVFMVGSLSYWYIETSKTPEYKNYKAEGEEAAPLLRKD